MRWTRLAALPAAGMLLSCGGDSTSPIIQALVDYVINYCVSPPAFVAIQAQVGGAWTPVTLDGSGKATVQLGDKFGLAVVRQNSISSWSTYIYYVTKTELPSQPTCVNPSGSKTLPGSVNTLSAGQETQVTMDGRNGFNFAGGTTSFTLTGVRNGAWDAMGQRRVTSTGIADKFIIRRAQDLTTGVAMSQFDFTAGSAVNPVSAAVTIGGVAPSDLRETYSKLYTTGGLAAFINSPTASNTAGTVYGIPVASGVSTDRHVVSLYVHNADYSATRGVDVFQQAVANLTMTAGPALSAMTVTVPSTSPKRLRFQWASQAEYGAVGDVYYWTSNGGNFRSVSVIQTAAYLGGTPTTWDIQPPVLTSVAGYPTAADMSNLPAMWSVQSVSSMAWYFHNATEVADGTVLKWAWQESAVAVEPGGQVIADGLRSEQGQRIQQMPRVRGARIAPR